MINLPSVKQILITFASCIVLSGAVGAGITSGIMKKGEEPPHHCSYPLPRNIPRSSSPETFQSALIANCVPTSTSGKYTCDLEFTFEKETTYELDQSFGFICNEWIMAQDGTFTREY